MPLFGSVPRSHVSGDVAVSLGAADTAVQPTDTVITRRRRIHPAAVIADFDPGEPMWVAHRCGGSTVGNYVVGPCPENTVEAGRACLADARAHGVPNFALNFQFRRSAGGGPVALHDEDVARVTSLTGNATDIPAWAMCGKVDAGTWHSPGWPSLDVPTLEEVLDEFGGRCALVLSAYRVGDPWIGQVIADAVVAHGLQDTVIVSSWTTTDLAPAKAAGIRTWYNPPTEGQSGSSAAEILAADTWAAGTPKYIGVDVASTQGYVESLTAAGLSVMIHYTRRRYERDTVMAYAGGVVGLCSDDPIYQATDVALHTSTVADPHALGHWAHGDLDADSSRGRGVITSGGRQNLTYDSNTQWVVVGGRCPTPASFTVTGTFCFESDPAGDATRNLGIYVCCPDDRRTSNLQSSGAGFVDGYVLWIRRNGAGGVSKRNYAAQTDSSLASFSWDAISVGQVVPFTVVVTATQVTFTRTDTNQTVTVTDSTYRGRYVHVGHSNNATASFTITRAS